MRKIYFRNCFYFILGIYLIILSSIKNTKAESGIYNSAKGTALATVVEGAVDITNVDADLIYDIFLDLDRESLTTDSVIKSKIIDSITSKPNSSVNIAYGDKGLSRQNRQENKLGYAIVLLRNEKGDMLKVKLKIDKTEMCFDDNGRSELKVDSEFFPISNQPNGTYRGIYYIIMSH